MKRELAITLLAVVAAAFLAVGYYSGQRSLPGGSAVTPVPVSPGTMGTAGSSAPASVASVPQPRAQASAAQAGPGAQAQPKPAAVPEPVARVEPPAPPKPTPTPPATPPTPPTPPPTPAAAAGSSGDSDSEPQNWRVPVYEDDGAFGPKDALATVVVFCAFGAPECSPFSDARTQLKEKFGDDVRVVFKHKLFPETPYAMDASMAALAAGAQGKFWEYHDKLFANSPAFDRGSLVRYAQEVGLKVPVFEKALDGSVYRGQTLRDALLANEIGAHSFPNILVNGVRLRDKTMAGLIALVEERLAVAKEWVKSGTAKDAIYEKSIEGGKFFPQLEPTKISVNTTNSAALGPEKGKEVVEIVLFEDFECPFCSKVGPPFKAFQKRFPDKVRLVFKHMPLSSIHPAAQLASEAAVEAQAQGKFWEYHDVLFANQKALERTDLQRYAEMIGLDMDKFNAALDNGTHRAAVQADFSEGGNAGVSGTPSVYLNGQKYAGPRGYPEEGIEAVARVYLGLTD